MLDDTNKPDKGCMRPAHSSRQVFITDAQTHAWSLLVINCHLAEMPHTTDAPNYTLQDTSCRQDMALLHLFATSPFLPSHALAAASLNRHVAGALLLVSFRHLGESTSTERGCHHP
jgi:hypothetical protein